MSERSTFDTNPWLPPDFDLDEVDSGFNVVVCAVPGCTEELPGPWTNEDDAQAMASWHIYEEHPDVWKQIVGDRPPNDHDPRKIDEDPCGCIPRARLLPTYYKGVAEALDEIPSDPGWPPQGS